MALSRSSVLHYWSARYGPLPIIGGDPTHARNSSAKWVDGQGIVQDAIINTPRFEHAVIASERRPVMRLELARTNSALHASDATNAAWSKGSCTAAKDAFGPDGIANSASTLTATGTGAFAYTLGSAIGAGTKQTVGGFVRGVNVTWCVVGDSGDAVHHRFWFNFATGAIGTIANCDRVFLRAVGGGWYEWSVSFTSTNAFTPRAQVAFASADNDTTAASGDKLQVALFQHEAGAAAGSSKIATTTAGVTRSTDVFHWDYVHPPQGKMVYLRFVERGTILISGARLLEIADASDNVPQTLLYFNGDAYAFYHHNGSGQVVSVMNVVPAVGDVVELIGILKPTGTVQVIQSINGAAVQTSAETATLALASAWSGPRLYLNSAGGSVGFGLCDFAEVKIVKYADVVGATSQARMDELREFELTASGDVIS